MWLALDELVPADLRAEIADQAREAERLRARVQRLVERWRALGDQVEELAERACVELADLLGPDDGYDVEDGATLLVYAVSGWCELVRDRDERGLGAREGGPTRPVES